jgi:hypothetical protein
MVDISLTRLQDRSTGVAFAIGARDDDGFGFA